MVDQALEGKIKPDAVTGLEDFVIQMEPAMKDNPDILRVDKIRAVFHLCHSHPFFWQHATRPEILDVVESLAGSSIKLYTDQMFVEPAHHGSEVPFHQDHGYWTMLEPYNMLSCWLAVDDATVENGCVRVIPGSHRELIPHSHQPGFQSWGLASIQVDVDREVPIELKAGSAMFHHSLLVHRSLANQSDKGRRGIATIYIPGEFRLVKPWDFPYGFKQIRE